MLVPSSSYRALVKDETMHRGNKVISINAKDVVPGTAKSVLPRCCITGTDTIDEHLRLIPYTSHDEMTSIRMSDNMDVAHGRALYLLHHRLPLYAAVRLTFPDPYNRPIGTSFAGVRAVVTPLGLESRAQ